MICRESFPWQEFWEYIKTEKAHSCELSEDELRVLLELLERSLSLTKAQFQVSVSTHSSDTYKDAVTRLLKKLEISKNIDEINETVLINYLVSEFLIHQARVQLRHQLIEAIVQTHLKLSIQINHLLNSLSGDVEVYSVLQEINQTLIQAKRDGEEVANVAASVLLSSIPKIVKVLAVSSRRSEKQITLSLLNQLEAIVKLQKCDQFFMESTEETSKRFLDNCLNLFDIHIDQHKKQKLFQEIYKNLASPKNGIQQQIYGNTEAVVKLRVFSTIVKPRLGKNSYIHLHTYLQKGFTQSLDSVVETQLKEEWMRLESSFRNTPWQEFTHSSLGSLQLARDYCKYLTRELNSDSVEAILQQATQNGLLSFWTNEIDKTITSALRTGSNDLASTFSSNLEVDSSACSMETSVSSKVIERLFSFIWMRTKNIFHWMMGSQKHLILLGSLSACLTIASNLSNIYSKQPILQLNPQGLIDSLGRQHPSHKLNNKIACGNHEDLNSRLIASWYGEEYQDKQTASGESFNKNISTAAYNALPFNTKLKVINLSNQQVTEVRVNDRTSGNSSKGSSKSILLSWQAAKELGIVKSGIAEVRVEIISECSTLSSL